MLSGGQSWLAHLGRDQLPHQYILGTNQGPPVTPVATRSHPGDPQVKRHAMASAQVAEPYFAELEDPLETVAAGPLTWGCASPRGARVHVEYKSARGHRTGPIARHATSVG